MGGAPTPTTTVERRSGYLMGVPGTSKQLVLQGTSVASRPLACGEAASQVSRPRGPSSGDVRIRVSAFFRTSGLIIRVPTCFFLSVLVGEPFPKTGREGHHWGTLYGKQLFVVFCSHAVCVFVAGYLKNRWQREVRALENGLFL